MITIPLPAADPDLLHETAGPLAAVLRALDESLAVTPAVAAASLTLAAEQLTAEAEA
jgi:hypothetical protein